MQNQNPQTPIAAQAGLRAACAEIRNQIISLRQDMYIAISLDEFVKIVNDYFKVVAEERGVEPVKVGKEDVKACIRYDDDVEIIKTRGGEALWLWSGAYMHIFMQEVAKLAVKYSDVMVWYRAEEGEGAGSP